MAEDDAWDADNFEPELPARVSTDDKWEGEDEDDEVKDSWEDADVEEEKKETSTPTAQAYQRPKKKSLAERIAEKEAVKKKEDEEKKAKDKNERREMTSEEKQAEKLRVQKIQEQESLSLAKGLFGMSETSIDKMIPSTEAEFSQFAEALKSKITFFEDSPHYPAFMVKLFSDLAVGLGVEEVKKLGVNLTTLYHEKERQRKEAEKKKKKKSKARIMVGKADDFDLIGDAAGRGYGGYDDDDDFI